LYNSSFIHCTSDTAENAIRYSGRRTYIPISSIERNFVIPITEIQIDCGNHDSRNTETMDIDIDL
jgi:hypothetical protein